MGKVYSYLSFSERSAVFLARSRRSKSALSQLPGEWLGFVSTFDLVTLAFAMQPRFSFLLRKKQGFATEEEAIQDFIDFNGPE